MLGFTIFWAYCAFFQAMLIQIANRPDEVTYYLARSKGGFAWLSLALGLSRFVLPFFVLLPRAPKFRSGLMAVVGGWIVLGQYLDVLWLILPDAESCRPARRALVRERVARRRWCERRLVPRCACAARRWCPLGILCSARASHIGARHEDRAPARTNGRTGAARHSRRVSPHPVLIAPCSPWRARAHRSTICTELRRRVAAAALPADAPRRNRPACSSATGAPAATRQLPDRAAPYGWVQAASRVLVHIPLERRQATLFGARERRDATRLAAASAESARAEQSGAH
jgi:hypothetical protein